MIAWLKRFFSPEEPIRGMHEAAHALGVAGSPDEVRAVLRRIPTEMGARGWAIVWLCERGQHPDAPLVLGFLLENQFNAESLSKRDRLPAAVVEGLLEFLERRPRIRYSGLGWTIMQRLVDEGALSIEHPRMRDVVTALLEAPDHAPTRRIALSHPDLPVDVVRAALPRACHGSANAELPAFLCAHGTDEEFSLYWPRLLARARFRQAPWALARMSPERKSRLAATDLLPLLHSLEADIRLEAMRHVGVRPKPMQAGGAEEESRIEAVPRATAPVNRRVQGRPRR